MEKYVRINTPPFEAVRITEEMFTGPHPNPKHVPGVFYFPKGPYVLVSYDEGLRRGNIGDWIVRDHDGRLLIYDTLTFSVMFARAESARGW